MQCTSQKRNPSLHFYICLEYKIVLISKQQTTLCNKIHGERYFILFSKIHEHMNLSNGIYSETYIKYMPNNGKDFGRKKILQQKQNHHYE